MDFDAVDLQNPPHAAYPVLAMGAGYLKAIDADAMLDQPIQALVRQAGGSAAVAVLDEFDALYVAHVTVDHAIRLSAAPGARQPACSTPIGHVLLAFQPQDLVTRHLQQRREQHGREEPIRNAASFERGLELVRTKGYATESDESDGIVSVVTHFRPKGPHHRSRELLGRGPTISSRIVYQDTVAAPPERRSPDRGHARAVSDAGHVARITRTTSFNIVSVIPAGAEAVWQQLRKENRLDL